MGVLGMLFESGLFFALLFAAAEISVLILYFRYKKKKKLKDSSKIIDFQDERKKRNRLN